MTNSGFSIGNNFQHYNGYIWTITEITGNWISLESKNQIGNHIVKGGMTAKDLSAIINAGYYKPLTNK